MAAHLGQWRDECIRSAYWWCRIAERHRSEDSFAYLMRVEMAKRLLEPYRETPVIKWR